ncbi:MAG: hypothetical protein V7724_15495 [Sediminicola sp.]
MKHQFLLFVFPLLGSLLLLSCSSDDNLAYGDDFGRSKTAWSQFKESSHDSYLYVVSGGSVFSTYGWKTTITVSKGTVIRREFAYVPRPEHIPADQVEWTENKDEINNHEHSNAADALTLAEIYTKAEKEWLIDRSGATQYFEADNNGLISICGYVEEGCMDDCFIGIRIESIEALN